MAWLFTVVGRRTDGIGCGQKPIQYSSTFRYDPDWRVVGKCPGQGTTPHATAIGFLTAALAVGRVLRRRRRRCTRASYVPGNSQKLVAGSVEAEYNYDLFIIGGGSAGVRAARWSADRYGARVALAELPFGIVSAVGDVGGLGGTCVIRGCVPKKLLVYGSRFHDDFVDALGYGWLWAEGFRPTLDWGKLLQSKDAEVRRLSGIYKGLLDGAGVETFQGHASLVDPHTVHVGDNEYTARYICVASGSCATIPDIPGNKLPGVVTSDEALALPRKPDRLVIIGGGYIALEFAGIFHSFGTEVHLVFRDNLPLRNFDNDVRSHVYEALTQRGIQIHSGESPLSIEEVSNGGLHVRTDRGTVLTADNVLFATGRLPNTVGMGLQNVGVSLDAGSGRVLVDNYSRTNIPSIYAVGDVTHRMSLTPVALMEGMAMAETLFGGGPTRPNYEGVPTAVFSQPEIGCCGLTEAEAATKYGSVDVYIARFVPMRHTMPTGRSAQERMLLKMVVVSDGFMEAGRVVGTHMVGADAAETMQGLAIAMRAGATKANFDATVGIHPTAAEEWATMRVKTRTTTARDVT